jgi:hypothetical protein
LYKNWKRLLAENEPLFMVKVGWIDEEEGRKKELNWHNSKPVKGWKPKSSLHCPLGTKYWKESQLKLYGLIKKDD